MATTTVQVTAFEHEIAFAQAEIKIEDAELESMERSEGLEAQRTVDERGCRRRCGDPGTGARTGGGGDRSGQDRAGDGGG